MKLSKIKMPEKGKPQDKELMELSEMEMSESEEMPEGTEGEESMGEEMPTGSDLSSLSDDELLAEIKKRGLSADLGGESEEEDELMA